MNYILKYLGTTNILNQIVLVFFLFKEIYDCENIRIRF